MFNLCENVQMTRSHLPKMNFSCKEGSNEQVILLNVDRYEATSRMDVTVVSFLFHIIGIMFLYVAIY